MNNNTFISLEAGDGSHLEAYVARPEGEGVFPGLILLQEAFGVNNHIRNIAQRLAGEGYVVIAPDLFHRTTPRIEIPYTDFAKAAPHYQALTKEGLVADITAAYNWLQADSSVVNGKIGAIGFCLGGRVSFLANATLKLQAAVSYYGGGIGHLLGETANLQAPHLFFWGGPGKHILLEQVQTIETALKGSGKDYINVVISYADHGFNCDERASYHPQAAQEAWSMTLAFLRNKLH